MATNKKGTAPNASTKKTSSAKTSAAKSPKASAKPVKKAAITAAKKPIAKKAPVKPVAIKAKAPKTKVLAKTKIVTKTTAKTKAAAQTPAKKTALKKAATIKTPAKKLTPKKSATLEASSKITAAKTKTTRAKKPVAFLNDGERWLKLATDSLDADKALDVVAIPLEGKSTIADYMVVASGTSTRHLASMADHLIQKFRAAGIKPLSTEGANISDWVLIDNPYVIVHLFKPELRQHYNIEKMWRVDITP